MQYGVATARRADQKGRNQRAAPRPIFGSPSAEASSRTCHFRAKYSQEEICLTVGQRNIADIVAYFIPSD
jgi:hypothetical protein